MNFFSTTPVEASLRKTIVTRVTLFGIPKFMPEGWAALSSPLTVLRAGQACANRITAERLERDQHEKHLAALRHVKCSIDNRPPPVHTHLANKLKTKKLQEDRAQEIQLENRRRSLLVSQDELTIYETPSSSNDIE